MKKFGIALFCFTVILCINCENQKKVKYSESILNSFSIEPEMFQKKYGGKIEYFVGDTEVQEKTSNISKVYIDSASFQATFWKQDKYSLQLLKIFDNSITIEGVEVIGKTRKEIIQIFGEPTDQIGTSISYKDNHTYLAFGFKDDIVIRASLGREM